MILSQAVEQYILHKRSLGIGFRSEVVRLRAFIQAIGDCEMHTIVEPDARYYASSKATARSPPSGSRSTTR